MLDEIFHTVSYMQASIYSLVCCILVIIYADDMHDNEWLIQDESE